MARFVDIETPYRGANDTEVKQNIRYARACVRDSLSRGEIPFASHLFFTQPGILDDNNPQERDRGIIAGKTLIEALKAATIVYTDRGTSEGMKLGIEKAQKSGRAVEYRTLGEDWEKDFSPHEGVHSHNGVW